MNEPTLIANLRRWLDRFSATAVERASLLRILTIFACLVVIFAGVFWMLARFGDAVVASGTTTKLSPWDAVYFSVVTITSLGYGDLAPVRAARLVACVEVIIGLAILGVFVAKLSSARVGFLVRRLYATDAQTRLNLIVIQYQNMRRQMNRVMAASGQAFAEVPDLTAAQQEQRSKLAVRTLADFDVFLSSFRDTSSSLCEYLQYEVEHGDFFEDAPVGPVQRAGEAMSQITFLLAQLIISLSASRRVEVFQPQLRTRLNEALQFMTDSCDVVLKYCADDQTRVVYADLKGMTDRVPQELFNVPAPVFEPPDQILPAAIEPQ